MTHSIPDRQARVRHAWQRVRGSERVRQMFGGERNAVVAALPERLGDPSDKELVRLKAADESEESHNDSSRPASADAVRFRLLTDPPWGTYRRWQVVADGLVIEDGVGALT